MFLPKPVPEKRKAPLASPPRGPLVSFRLWSGLAKAEGEGRGDPLGRRAFLRACGLAEHRRIPYRPVIPNSMPENLPGVNGFFRAGFQAHDL